MLHGKFRRPIFPGGYVVRPRLIEKIDTFSDLPLTIVEAPAGYGKTTLVNAWAEKSSVPVVWLSLDENDNDLRVFVSYLVRALRTRFPGILKKTFALSSALVYPPFNALSKCVVSELDNLGQNLALVLDNYELMRDQQIHELIASLLKYPLPQLHILLVTRHDPPLPVSSLRARNLMGEITVSDLLFSREEAMSLFSNEISLGKISEAQFESIFREMEGWVTGLSLCAASLTSNSEEKESIATLDWPLGYVKDYLSSEVLQRITAPSRDLLCRVSIVNEFCAGLCEVLFQDPVLTVQLTDGASFIRRLERENLFISPSVFESGWYRLQPAFRATLKAHLEENYTTQEIEYIHTAAAYWYASQGRFKDALYHVQNINISTALDIFRIHYIEILELNTLHILEEWLSLFPANIFDFLPELLFAKAWLMLKNMRFPETADLLDKVESLLEASGNDSLEKWKVEPRVLRAMYFVRTGNTTLALDYLQSLDSAQLGGDFLREVVAATQCQAYRLMGDVNGCTAILRDSIAFTRTTRNGHTALHLLPSTCMLNVVTARLGEAERTAYLMMEIAKERNNQAYTGIASLCLGVVAYHKNELGPAEGYFTDALGRAEFFDAESVITCYLGLAATEQALGNNNMAHATIEKAKSFLTSIHSLDILPYIEIFDAEMLLRQGIQLHHSPDNLPEWRLLWTEILYHPVLTICRQFLGKGPEGGMKALAILKKLYEHARSINNELLCISVIAQIALAFEATERPEEARESLKKALELSEQTGYLRIFLDFGMPMARLLQQSDLPQTGMVTELLDAFSREAPLMTDCITRTLLEHLTERELRVLDYLRQRFSNKEIADCLYVTPATVKSHTIHIYQKLGVNGRREAVEKARNLGIFIS